MKPVQKKRPALFQKESPISVKLGKNAFLFFWGLLNESQADSSAHHFLFTDESESDRNCRVFIY